MKRNRSPPTSHVREILGREALCGGNLNILNKDLLFTESQKQMLSTALSGRSTGQSQEMSALGLRMAVTFLSRILYFSGAQGYHLEKERIRFNGP